MQSHGTLSPLEFQSNTFKSRRNTIDPAAGQTEVKQDAGLSQLAQSLQD
jgi:hypothetical protein